MRYASHPIPCHSEPLQWWRNLLFVGCPIPVAFATLLFRTTLAAFKPMSSRRRAYAQTEGPYDIQTHNAVKRSKNVCCGCPTLIAFFAPYLPRAKPNGLLRGNFGLWVAQRLGAAICLTPPPLVIPNHFSGEESAFCRVRGCPIPSIALRAGSSLFRRVHQATTVPNPLSFRTPLAVRNLLYVRLIPIPCHPDVKRFAQTEGPYDIQTSLCCL